MTDAIQTSEKVPTADLLPEPAEHRDLLAKFKPLIQEREALLATGVRDPFAIVMSEVKSPTLAVIQGKDGTLHAVYSYFVTKGKSMKHAAFNEAWVKEGDK